jgi:hypothetical protein
MSRSYHSLCHKGIDADRHPATSRAAWKLYRLPARPAARFRREKPQQFRRGKAIGRSGFDAELEIVDRIARGLPETPVDLPMIKPKAFEQALYLRLLRPAQENLAVLPMAARRGFAFDPLREQAKRKGIGIRIIGSGSF